MKPQNVFAATLALTLLAGPTADAQSLGDLARKEAERRGTAPTAGKTYTNENLTPDFTKPAPPEPEVSAAKAEAPATGADAAAKPEPATAATPEAQQEAGEPEPLDEAFWRDRAQLIRARIASQNAQVEQLRDRMSATRGVNDAEREVLERTFNRATTDLKHLNDEWVRFETRARARGVPENWIR